MRSLWKDVAASVLAVAGGVVVFAKLQSYSWWLIGSWKGAVGVVAVIGLAILLTNIVELVRNLDLAVFVETLAWLMAATVVVASLFSTTTKAEFVASSIMVGLAWFVQFMSHLWRMEQSHRAHRYLPVH